MIMLSLAILRFETTDSFKGMINQFMANIWKAYTFFNWNHNQVV